MNRNTKKWNPDGEAGMNQNEQNHSLSAREKNLTFFFVFSLLVMIWEIVVNINRILKIILTKASSISFKKLRLFLTY